MDHQQQAVVLVIDDEEKIRTVVEAELTEQGFRVITSDGREGLLELAEKERPDVALIDVLMPEHNGFEVARQLHQLRPIPFLFVTGCDRRSDRVRGLEFGATDYVVKPFDPDELGSRIRAILRRVKGPTRKPALNLGSVEIDMESRIVRRNGELVTFSRNEWKLFQFLATHPNRVLLTGDILAQVWGEEYREENQYLRVWISRIRAKIEDDSANPKLLKTHPGVGYIFVTEHAEADAEDDGAYERAETAAATA